LDEQSFGAWLAGHGQSDRAVERFWDLVVTATVNLPSGQASLQMADVVFRTGLLTERTAGDLGYPTVPLAELHADAAQRALRAGGVDARLDVTARRLVPGRPFVVETDKGAVQGDAVILAVPHPEAAALLPADALSGRPDIRALGVSPILNVHVVYDRRVTDLAFAAAVDSPVQWVFDRTGPSGLGRGQYLAVSVSAAERCIDRPSRELCRQFAAGLQELFPHARAAGVLDMFVTRERTATFRATPGSARLRPGPTTKVDRLFLAGAWTDTGWPATMEGAVRSGRAAAAAAYQRLGDPAPDQLPSPAPARTHTGAMA
jgi:squalene-associated FAD-dependent desaturase